MNILFLTLLDFESLEDSNLYTDLLREFTKHGHIVYVITPLERRQKKSTYIVEKGNSKVLRLKTPNSQKIGILEKGISLLSIPFLYKLAIKKYFSDIRFELIIYSTPPITLTPVVDYVKHRDGAKAYLLLKDIFPQNAVDIGLMSQNGAKGLVYKYFKNKERQLYAISDYIGCMSPANKEYLMEHNPEIDKEKIDVCPNCVEVVDKSINKERKRIIRNKHGIPQDKIVFVYGGNLGKPQGIPFLIKCLSQEKDNTDIFFVIVGNGTEYGKIDEFLKTGVQNVKLIPRVPKEDYDELVAACDVGMIFLDHRFTIPNFPSRLLGYMQAKLPILAVTDPNTDIGRAITEGGFGWWCESINVEEFSSIVQEIKKTELQKLGERGFIYLQEHYDVKEGYKIIMDSLETK